MASIKKRGSGGFTISIYIGRDKDGKRKYHYETFYGNKTQANFRAKQLEVQLKKRIGPKNSVSTVEELFDVWLEDIKDDLDVRTYEKYCWHANRLKPLLGDLQLYDLNTHELKQRLKGLTGLAERTIRDLFCTTRTVMRFAVSSEFISTDPSQGIRIPKLSHKERPVLSQDQLAKLLEVAKHYKHYLVIRLLSVTGMRVSEALGLKWKDIDFNKSEISIVRSCDIKKKTLKDTKTKNSIRTIELDSNTMTLFQNHKEFQSITSSLDTLVFTADSGGPLSRNAVRKSLDRILKKAGLEYCRIHDLRHTAGSICIDEGIPLTTVASLLGNRPATLAQTYAHAIKKGACIAKYVGADN